MSMSSITCAAAALLAISSTALAQDNTANTINAVDPALMTRAYVCGFTYLDPEAESQLVIAVHADFPGLGRMTEGADGKRTWTAVTAVEANETVDGAPSPSS